MDSHNKLAQKMEIKNNLLELIYKIKQVNPAEGQLDKAFSYDLGLDSLAKVELAGAIQRDFGVNLTAEEIAAVDTLDELVHAIARKQKHGKQKLAELPLQNRENTVVCSFVESRGKKLLRTVVYRLLNKVLQNHFQLDVHGQEHISLDKPFIIAANHTSHLDSPSLMLASGLSYDDFVLLAAKDYFFEQKSWKLTLLNYLFNLIPFDRHAESFALQTNIALCKRCIKEHKKLILFPEATRSINGELQPFKGGVALIAYELNIPIIPAYIEGAYECLPKGKSWPKKGKVRVTFGKPMLMENYQSSSTELRYQLYKQITQELEQQIKELRSME